jgi:putative aldouronate transport system permease protein
VLRKRLIDRGKDTYLLYALLLPGLLYYFVFHYIPMYGVLISFKDFNIFKGFWDSPWVGFDNFTYLFSLPEFYNILRNTLVLNFLSLLFGFPAPIAIALLLNEITNRRLSSLIKSTLYLPHFFSWIVIGGIIVNLLSPKYGIVNAVLQWLGLPTIFFLGDPDWWVFSYVVSGIWKEAGWGAIIYIAALSGIDSELYEAAKIDGANRWKQMIHITLPGLKPTIVIMLILKLGQILEIGFEQPFVLSNPLVYDISDVISTYIYKAGILQSKFSLTTAMGFFQSLIGFLMIVGANKLIKKMGEEGIF